MKHTIVIHLATATDDVDLAELMADIETFVAESYRQPSSPDGNRVVPGRSD